MDVPDAIEVLTVSVLRFTLASKPSSVTLMFWAGSFDSNSHLNLSNQVKKNLIYQTNHLNKLAKLNNMDLGQYLFSESIYLCNKRQYKGVVINTSNINRLSKYLDNHKNLISNEVHNDLTYPIADKYLADPRQWKI